VDDLSCHLGSFPRDRVDLPPTEEVRVIRVLVLYRERPDAGQYAEHAELCRRVPGGTFRHGPVFGAPMGAPEHAYAAEWEFPDREAFRQAAASEEFRATGKDASERGFPRPSVEFLELE
jgi:hypothetical protein